MFFLLPFFEDAKEQKKWADGVGRRGSAVELLKYAHYGGALGKGFGDQIEFLARYLANSQLQNIVCHGGGFEKDVCMYCI